MKIRIAVALALAAGFGIGAVTVETVRAQAKPPVFVVGEINITNMDGYMKEYAPRAQALIQQKGGRLLAASANVTALEGAKPTGRVAVQQWENMDKVKAWYDSPEYKENRKIGDKYAKFRIYVVEGRPQP